MERIVKIVAATLAITLHCSCNDSPQGQEAEPSDDGQSFIVAVESMGELFTGGEGVAAASPATRRPISSVAPSQTFDKMSIIIVENRSPATVVYKHTIDGWSSPNNKASIPWSTEAGQGRYTVISLPDGLRLSEGISYMAYAIGYQTGTFGGYEPFKGIEAGDSYSRTEAATVPPGGAADEIFAGAETFMVKDGVILSQRSDGADAGGGVLIARRQVAGTFGFFTRIPATIGGSDVATLRLVATRRNRTVIFGGFRGLDDAYDFNKDNVINGMDPRTDYDARLAGSSHNDAFVVYDIHLAKWFPGNTADPRLPLDMNGDGYLDSGDTNWQTDGEMYPEGTISLPRGSVFGERFWIAVAMTQEDVNTGTPTFQMQLLDAEGEAVKYWDVALQDFDSTDVNRTLVTLPDGTDGRTKISLVENLDTETCFSIVRNRLYAMGEKSQSQTYGEDVPVDLSEAGTLVLNARHQWQIQSSVIFN